MTVRYSSLAQGNAGARQTAEKMRQAIPNYTLPSGPVSKEISSDQYGLGWAVEGAEADEAVVPELME